MKILSAYYYIGLAFRGNQVSLPGRVIDLNKKTLYMSELKTGK